MSLLATDIKEAPNLRQRKKSLPDLNSAVFLLSQKTLSEPFRKLDKDEDYLKSMRSHLKQKPSKKKRLRLATGNLLISMDVVCNSTNAKLMSDKVLKRHLLKAQHLEWEIEAVQFLSASLAMEIYESAEHFPSSSSGTLYALSKPISDESFARASHFVWVLNQEFGIFNSISESGNPLGMYLNAISIADSHISGCISEQKDWLSGKHWQDFSKEMNWLASEHPHLFERFGISPSSVLRSCRIVAKAKPEI